MNYGPYHVARWRAAAKFFGRQGIEVVPIQGVLREEQYQWDSPAALAKGAVPIRTILTMQSMGKATPLCSVSSLHCVRATWKQLEILNLSGLAIPGYSDWMSLTSLAWVQLKHRVAVLMSESKYDDYPRTRLREEIKRLLLRLFDAALVGGYKQQEYYVSLGMRPDRIFLGYDVVDNDYFMEKATQARSARREWCNRLRLPEMEYFMSAGRFVDKKNFAGLIHAYASYLKRCNREARQSGWDLVLCGNGPLDDSLRENTMSLGINNRVHFAGFQQYEILSIYYGLAGAFVMPSFHSEQWGLVVNEAMAAGLPVIVSKAAGSSAELVKNGINGFVFDPSNPQELADCLFRISSMEESKRQEMGQASIGIIREWGLERFSEGLWHAFMTAGLLTNRRL
jgi:glycosyltransferase involved in cell wall biosynthesis